MEAGSLARNEQDHCVRETTGAVLVFPGDKSRKERPIEREHTTRSGSMDETILYRSE